MLPMSDALHTVPLVLSPGRDAGDRFFDVELVGGKAANLKLLLDAKVPVPEWLCVTTRAFDLALQPVALEIQSLVEGALLKSASDALDLESKVRTLIRGLAFPDELRRDLAPLLSDADALWAVRSSATGEDSSLSSFAGQFETFLFVPTASVFDSILDCWASAYQSRVLQYFATRGQQHTVRMAVVVQKMVRSTVSGVMFTKDPRTRSGPHLVITAGFGLGEGVVSDRVETDTFIVDKDGRCLESHIGEKLSQVVFDVSRGRATILAPVDPSCSLVPSLSKEEIHQLVLWANKIEAIAGKAQDIEWAFDASRKLQFTQTRPITTVDKAPPRKFIFDNSNVVESFPDVNTPLTLQLIRPIYAKVFSRALRSLGMSVREVKEQHFLFNNLLGDFKGRVFYNLTLWYEMMRFFPYTERYISVWEKMLGVETSSELAPKATEALQRHLRFYKGVFSIVFHYLFLGYNLNRLEKRFLALHAKFWAKENSRVGQGFADVADFEREFEAFFESASDGWEVTLINDIFAFLFSSLTQRVLRKMSDSSEESERVFNSLMLGIDGMDSVEPLESLQRLVAYRKVNGADVVYAKLFKEHVEKFGDRGTGELKFETVTMRESHAILDDLVAKHERQELVEHVSSRALAGRRWLQKSFWRWPFWTILLLFVLGNAQRSILYREKFRLHRSRYYGVLRRLIRRMGFELASRKILENPEDVFFLEIPEICAIASGRSYCGLVSELVASRKHRYVAFKQESVEGRYTRCNLDFVPFEAVKSDSEMLKGQGCSHGIVTAEAVVVTDISVFDEGQTPVEGKILVAPMTDPGWVFLMSRAAGLVVEKGSMLSHTAIIGRELGIPTVVGVKNATRIIKTGQRIRMDAATGEVHHV